MKTTRSATLSDSLPTPPGSGFRRPASAGSSEPVECPRCSKRTIVKRSHNTFDCLNCSFRKQLPPVATSASPLQAHPTNVRTTYLGTQSVSRYPTALHSPFEIEPEGEKPLQPLVFAAIAVIVGIILL